VARATDPSPLLLDPLALARYDGLALHVRRGMGERPGDRRFPGRPEASGTEIEAHAAYVPGDDLRHLDWSALGRLDALVVRRFTAEREVLFHLLLDLSGSMAVPAHDRKLATARELVLALAFIALGANDGVRLALLAGGGAARISRTYRQRSSIGRVAELLGGAAARGSLDLGAALADYACRHPRPGAAIVVSDLMLDPAVLERGVWALRARRYEVLLLHLPGASELDPAGAITSGVLEDAESGATHAVSLGPATLARYRQVLHEHLEALRALAARTGATYARLAPEVGVERFVTLELPRLGVVRRR
jgi:uncharacterized protein (DUF58 family)